MVSMIKWSTPTKHFTEPALQEATRVFGYCLANIENGQWTPAGFSKDYRGYLQPLHHSEYFSAMGLVLKNFMYVTDRAHADEVIEILITIIGSECNKMGYTSPRDVEMDLLKKGVITLFQRCQDACMFLIVENRTEADTAYIKQTEKGIATTKSGKVLTDDDMNNLADEAERGYDITQMIPRDKINEAREASEETDLHRPNEAVLQEREETRSNEEEPKFSDIRGPAKKLSPGENFRGND